MKCSHNGEKVTQNIALEEDGIIEEITICLQCGEEIE